MSRRIRLLVWVMPAACVFAQTSEPESQWNVAPGTWVLGRPQVLPNSPALVKSLGDAAEYVLRWRLPSDAEGWRLRRPVVERALRKAIGLEKLPERTPLNARIAARHDMGDYVIENLLFESRPRFPVTANLYLPKSSTKEKHPAILAPIGHYISAGKTAADVQARCINLARMGFVVLTYDAIGQGERMIPGNIHHEAGYALLPMGETIAGWMVWDSMRAIDYLLTRPEVDPQRIGVTGNSGGGLNTLFTAALDPRVRAAVVVGYTFEFNNWIKYAGAHCACTQLPGLFRAMEWFEIAGLIAPRAVMMIQGTHDGIFPISGARHAGHNTETLYGLLAQRGRARFVELPGQRHAYSRPYRERMYGWMARHLLGRGAGEPIAEAETHPLDEKDRRLLCDPEETLMPRSPAVVALARAKAMEALDRLPAMDSAGARESVRRWVLGLTAPPDADAHFLAPAAGRKATAPGGVPERFSFVSEDGQYIPGLLWLPERRESPDRTVLIADDRGKGAVAESGLVMPLLDAGLTVVAVDLRGRGETLGRFRPGFDTNFRLAANQVLFGRPLAGRRAFDLMRAVDYLELHGNPAPTDLTVVGIGDDALPVLLAAAADPRIRRAAVVGYLHSQVSQMRAMAQRTKLEMPRHWNDAELLGRLNTGGYEVDLGSVIPYALDGADLPEIAASLAPRKLLFCQARDNRAPDIGRLAARFQRVAGRNVTYLPDRTLDAGVLLEWLRD